MLRFLQKRQELLRNIPCTDDIGIERFLHQPDAFLLDTASRLHKGGIVHENIDPVVFLCYGGSRLPRALFI